MTDCKYCEEELKRASGSGFVVCDCWKAKKDWGIHIDIQSHQEAINNLRKELKDLEEVDSE